jgi:sterol desaturase/sphingolipid hydroxylase (fatty acid hydroxylase superfamily)
MMAMSLAAALTLKAALVAVALVLFGTWERLRPAAASPLLVRLGRATRAGWRRLGRNLGLLGLNVLLSPLLVIPVTAWAGGVELGLRPAWWGGWLGLGLDLLLLDLWLYWWHRANHELPLLWRFHAVHHLDETLDVTSAVRFHAGEVALSAGVRAAVIVAFGIPLATVVLFEGLILAAAIFHHSDARLPAGVERALARLVVTPSLHWVHHHARRADTDSNYATVLSVWDRLFRTRSATARTAEMPIGVEGLRDRPLPALLAAPLARQAGPGRGRADDRCSRQSTRPRAAKNASSASHSP